LFRQGFGHFGHGQMPFKPRFSDESEHVVGTRGMFEAPGICLNRTKISFGLATDQIRAMVVHVPDFNNPLKSRYNFIRGIVMPPSKVMYSLLLLNKDG
jgi:hypothetical protein